MTLRKLRKRLWLNSETLLAQFEIVIDDRARAWLAPTRRRRRAAAAAAAAESLALVRSAQLHLAKIQGYCVAAELVHDTIRAHTYSVHRRN